MAKDTTEKSIMFVRAAKNKLDPVLDPARINDLFNVGLVAYKIYMVCKEIVAFYEDEFNEETNTGRL